MDYYYRLLLWKGERLDNIFVKPRWALAILQFNDQQRPKKHMLRNEIKRGKKVKQMQQ